MTFKDLRNIGELCLEAGHNRDRILLFMTKEQYEEEFEWLIEPKNGSGEAMAIIDGPPFEGIPTLALIKYAGYSYHVIDHNRLDETIDVLKKKNHERTGTQTTGQ